MAKQIYMIRMGQTMQAGTIVRWLKNEGEFVEKGDPLYEMEYDKATAVAEAKNSGYLHIIAEEGDTVPVTTVVGQLLEEGEMPEGAASEPEKVENTPEVPAIQEAALAKPEQSNQTVLAMPYAKKIARDNDLDIAAIKPANGQVIRKVDVEGYLKHHGKPLATPFAKKIAKEKGIDLTSLGIEGRIYSKDVLAAVERVANFSPEKQTFAQPKQSIGETTASDARPMSPLRKTIAARMTESYFSSPVVTFMREADTTELDKFYRMAKEELKKTGLRITVTDLLIRACARALSNKPYMNVSLDGNNILYKKDVNIGLAVAVEGGLLVPVIKNADKLSMREIALERMRLVEGARNRSLSGEDMRGGTFTITNLGAMGIDFFTPILNPPETAIIGIGRSEDKVVVVNGEMTIRNRMGLSLTADHRVIDGAAAAEFMEEVVAQLSNPVALVF